MAIDRVEPYDRGWEAGIDYLRLTHTGDVGRVGAMHAYEGAVRHAAAACAEGAIRAEDWSWQGYRGTQQGKAAWGAREDGCLLQVSGWWASVPALLAMPYTGVPRLDVALTVWGEASPADIPRAAAAASARARAGRPGKPWRVRLEDGHGDGDTCYVGSRESELYIRVYDKEKESPDDETYVGATRYEVELKGSLASAYYAQVVRARGDARICARIVLGLLADRGIPLPQSVSLESEPRVVVRKEASSAQQSLAWLAGQVRPTVSRLLAAGVPWPELRDALFGPDAQEALAALGVMC